ncbi:hypothetical protein KPaMU14_04695 [Kocuria palustris]|nr:hypothetical protein KPaMU14_04695 [Kocuria palustris]
MRPTPRTHIPTPLDSAAHAQELLDSGEAEGLFVPGEGSAARRQVPQNRPARPGSLRRPGGASGRGRPRRRGGTARAPRPRPRPEPARAR